MRPPVVGAEVDQVVARHAVVLQVRRAVVVRRAAEHHRGPEVVGRRMQEAGVDDGRHPGPGAAGAPEELHIVAPEEELLSRQADPCDQLPGDEHAVERDDHVGEEPVPGRALDLRHPVHHAGAAGYPDGEAKPGRVVLGQHGRSPEVQAVTPQQPGQTVGVGPAVVVHEPGQVGAPLHRPGQPFMEPPGTAAVLGERAREHGDGALTALVAIPKRVQPPPRAVGRGVVDHQHLGQPGDSTEPREQPPEQRKPVVGHHDRDDPALFSRRLASGGHGVQRPPGGTAVAAAIVTAQWVRQVLIGFPRNHELVASRYSLPRDGVRVSAYVRSRATPSPFAQGPDQSRPGSGEGLGHGGEGRSVAAAATDPCLPAARGRISLSVTPNS